MTAMDKSLQQKVRLRAKGACEYCRLPEALSELGHVVDHIVARQHRGRSALDNLAFACGRCNRHKGPNVAGVDPKTGAIVRLFNPRRDKWGEHFAWKVDRLVGRSDVGRVTIEVLAINHPYRLAARRVLIKAGKLPVR
jgi:HNH endonuclease